MMRLAWCVPDVACVAACVTLFYCLFLFQGYRRFFHDSDTGWHILNGETIIATGAMPRSDPYSFTRAGQPWFAWEWGADAVMGVIHRVAGLSGVALFYGAAIAAGVWFWFQLHWVTHGSFLLAAVFAPLLLSTANLHWLARPHVIGWLFLLAAVIWVEREPRGVGWRQLLLVAGFCAVWANVHASFFLAPMVAAIYGMRNRSMWIAAAVALVAPLANPYGWRLYQHIFRYLTDSELLARIGEFQSFDFHVAGSTQIVLGLMVGMLGGGLALAQGRFDRCAMSVVFTAMALRSARGLPLATLVLLPLANAAFTRQWKDSGFMVYSARLRAIDSRFRGWIYAPVMLIACFALLRTPAIAESTGFPPDDFPVAAYSHIADGGRLFAPDKYGGYLIYRSRGERKVFMDGRSDLYGADFLKQYSRLMQARPGWQEIWKPFHFTQALLPNETPLMAALQGSGWETIYRDGVVTLLQEGGTNR